MANEKLLTEEEYYEKMAEEYLMEQKEISAEQDKYEKEIEMYFSGELGINFATL